MDKKTKVLAFFLVAFFVISISAKYYNFVIAQDYIVDAEISCDTETESCFVWDCDIEEDEECDHTPYKYISKNISDLPYCDPYTNEAGECPELSCSESDNYCEVFPCSEDELGEEEYCFDSE